MRSLQRPTLKDVARSAGVSRTTASDALRGEGRVSEATAEKVRNVAKQMGYSGDPVAARLRSRAATNIGLYVPQAMADIGFHMQFMIGAAAGARERNLDLTLLSPSGDQARRRHSLVDGLLMIEATRTDSEVHRLAQLKLPTLMIGAQPGSRVDTPVFRIDHGAAIMEALDHLASRGSRRPALVGPAHSFGSDWSEQVISAYSQWCAGHGVAVLHRDVGAIPNGVEIENRVGELLSQGADAFIGAHEGAAAQVLLALQRLGIEPGVDMPVVSGVASQGDAFTSPPLTAIEMYPWEFGRQAALLLTDIIEGAASPGEVWEHDVQLICRASSGVLAEDV